MNKTKQETPPDTRTDGDKFEDALRTIFSVSKEEVKSRMDETKTYTTSNGKSKVFKTRK